MGLTQVVGQHAEEWGDQAHRVEGWFGTIGQSMFTLFRIMTLVGWPHITQTVSQQNPVIIPFMFFYIMFSSYTLVSLITGTISESLISAQREDEEIRVKELQQERLILSRIAEEIFENLDTDKSGELSKEDIAPMLEDGCEFMARLQAQGINLTKEDIEETFWACSQIDIKNQERKHQAARAKKEETNRPADQTVAAPHATRILRGTSQSPMHYDRRWT